MLNYLWSAMILSGILWAALWGRLDAVTQGALEAAKEAVALSVTMLGVMTLWTGILEVGKRAGLVERLAESMRPVIRFLFPRLEPDGEAARQICVNLIANILGLGWAATPAGLKAMEELKKVEQKRREKAGGQKKTAAPETAESLCPMPPDTASNEMCTFLIINISSLQLIPMNMIACRSQYGSQFPAAVLGPSLAATLFSTAAAVIFIKLMDRAGPRGRGD